MEVVMEDSPVIDLAVSGFYEYFDILDGTAELRQYDSLEDILLAWLSGTAVEDCYFNHEIFLCVVSVAFANFYDKRVVEGEEDYFPAHITRARCAPGSTNRGRIFDPYEFAAAMSLRRHEREQNIRQVSPNIKHSK